MSLRCMDCEKPLAHGRCYHCDPVNGPTTKAKPESSKPESTVLERLREYQILSVGPYSEDEDRLAKVLADAIAEIKHHSGAHGRLRDLYTELCRDTTALYDENERLAAIVEAKPVGKVCGFTDDGQPSIEWREFSIAEGDLLIVAPNQTTEPLITTDAIKSSGEVE